MSLNIMVGVLSTGEMDDEPRSRVLDVVESLQARGLVSHDEPNEIPGGLLVRSVTSGWGPLGDYAARVSRLTDLEFPHILEPRCWVPIAFEDVLEATDEVEAVGSSHALFDECRTLLRCMDLYHEFSDVWAPNTLTLRIDEALGLKVEDVAMNEPPIVRADDEGHWPPHAGACMKLYDAAKHSIRHGACIVLG